MKLFKTYRPSSLLGLALEGRQLEGVLLRRSNGGFKVARRLHATLSLDLLTDDPELVGREIRNHLEEAGINERRCALCVPLQWALTLSVPMPDLPAADAESFLHMEAERGFPYSPEDLSIVQSRHVDSKGGGHVSQVAIPKGHLARLEKSLRAARLKPVSFSLGITTLNAVAPSTEGLLTLTLGEGSVEILVATGGGVAALRTIEGAFETAGGKACADADLVSREIRITLGQLPKELRDPIKRVRVFGPEASVRPLLDELRPVLKEMNLACEVGVPPSIDGFDAQAPGQSGAAGAAAIAVEWLNGEASDFEFLPPRENPLTQVLTRFSSRRVLYAGAGVGAVVLVVGLMFFWQQWRLSSLESRWREIKPRVDDIVSIQQQMRKFRPWFDVSAENLRVLRKLTEAFPVEGSVTAKTLEIKDLSEISCSGQARDNQAMLKLLDQLREAPAISDVKVQQVRGKSPLQFNLSFHWTEGANHEN
jgi:hypothetical protein